MEHRKPRRFIVRSYAGSPGWSGDTFAYSCTTLQAAKRCFTKLRNRFCDGGTDTDAILLIDRQKHKVLDCVGTVDPNRVASFLSLVSGNAPIEAVDARIQSPESV